ncbi:MAG: CDP-alcohol phosphatidyltransferase family protein [Longimicrobiales bacterium]
MATERRNLDTGSSWTGSLTWANAISLLRIPMGAAFILDSRTETRVTILIAAAVSDYLDGWVARTFGQATRAGEILDPATDKLFVLSALASYLRSGVFAGWELIVLLARDVVTAGAFAIAAPRKLPVRFRARFSGKVVTTLQIATVFVATVLPQATRSAVLLTGAASAWAITDYLLFGARSLRAAEPPG